MAARRRSAAAALLALLVLPALCHTAAAETPLRLRPGLWEMHTRLEGGDARTAHALAQSRAQIAALPPAQRERLEQSLAGRGIELQLAGDALTARVCITRAMAEQDEVAAAPLPLRSDCRLARRERSGDTVRFATLCREPRATVEGATTFLSDRAFESKTVHTTEAGRDTRMTTIEQSGRWLGPDCGAAAAQPTR